MTYLSETEKSSNMTVMDCLLEEYYPRVVVIGGPGKGKSTLGQQLAQIHRNKLIGKKDYQFKESKTVRIPFRIVLKYFAQWLAKKPDVDSLEAYIAEKMGVLTSRPKLVSPKDIQDILCCRPCLLILDGLDEVGFPELQEKMLARIKNFLSTAEMLNADLMVVATSRPKEFDKHYKNYFNTERFLHLELIDMSAQKVNEYAKKWVLAKKLKQEDKERIISTLEECQQDGNTSALLTSPLYVTIILLIIKGRGRPPSQKEELFRKYWDVIFAREKSKDKGMIQTDESLLLDLHSYLGHLLHQRAAEENIQSRLPEDEFRNVVREFLRQKNRHSTPESINRKMETLLKDGDRLVLITEANDLFGFDIRSFQEFFAAVHLVETAEDTAQRFERLKNIIYLQHWHNVALFFVGRIARSYEGEARKILKLCKEIDQEKKNYYLRPGAWFALEVASDGAFSKINPDLQYDFIEYGLKVLDTGLTTDQKEALESFIDQLSQEDKHELLHPLLEEKLRSLSDLCSETVLELYAQHFGAEKPFQDKIDALLKTCRDTTVITALHLAMSYKCEPLWMIERLISYWNYYKKIFNESGFSWYEIKMWFSSLEYTESVLRVSSFSEDQANTLANVFSKEVYYDSFDFEPEVIWDLPKPTMLSEQLILLLRCSRLLAYLRMQTNKFKNISLGQKNGGISQNENDIFVRMKMVGLRLSKPMSKELINNIQDILQSDNLIPRLEISLWSLFWLLKEPNLDNVSEFMERVKLIHETSSLSHKWWRSNSLSQNWPLLNLALDKQLVEGKDSFNKLLPFLEAKKQVHILEEIEGAILKYRQQSDDIQNSQKLIIAIQTQMGLDELLPQLVPLANQIGVTVEDLVETYIYSHSNLRKFKCETEELHKIFTNAEDSIEQHDKLRRLLWCLIEVEWSSYLVTLKKAQHLLESILSKWKESSDLTLTNLCLAYFFKLLNYDTHIKTIIPHLSTILPLNKLLSNRQAEFIHHISGVYYLNSLTVLKSFINDEDESIRLGSILILYVISGLSDRYKYREQTEIQELLNVCFNVETAWDMINSDDNKNFLVGIAQLSFSNYPIEDDNYRQMLLTGLQKTQFAGKEEAWVNMLQNILIPIEKYEIWRNLLEEILGKPWSYSNSILSAAMERYQKISNNLVK
jgi:nucleoside-triphosphatase THEP1